jgi:Effector Associated Constant Component 1
VRDVVVTVGGDATGDDLRMLRSWLVREDELRGRVSLVSPPAEPGAMGLDPDTLMVTLGPGAATGAFAGLLMAWLRSRSMHLSVKATRTPSQARIDVVVRRVGRLDPAIVRQHVEELSRVVSGMFGARHEPAGVIVAPRPAGSGDEAAGQEPGAGLSASTTPAARTAVRLGFAVDVANYSARTASAQTQVQQRLTDLVREVLSDVNLDVGDTDYHGRGDGMVVFLPSAVEIHRVVPHLIHGMDRWLGFDNARSTDRLRLRMALTVGPLGPAAIGYSGHTIIECARLVDSQVIREALAHHDQSDLAVLVSDGLYAFATSAGHPSFESGSFQRVVAQAKDFHAHAWLWVAPGPRLAALTGIDDLG